MKERLKAAEVPANIEQRIDQLEESLKAADVAVDNFKAEIE